MSDKSDKQSLVQKMLERRMFYATAAYLGTSLVVLRLADAIGGLFGLSETFEQVLAVLLIVGFPFMLIWVWRGGLAGAAKNTGNKLSAAVENADASAGVDIPINVGQIIRMLGIVALVIVPMYFLLRIDQWRNITYGGVAGIVFVWLIGTAVTYANTLVRQLLREHSSRPPSLGASLTMIVAPQQGLTGTSLPRMKPT